ncbi:glycosyltransferase [Microbacterium arborescens]|uniref:glycosyltransferase n=1 Tax=Microbacterium arborescens TaxID=33883 RepID=UPI0027D7E357|nr:glycosyltransferase [Microbacterium arborescens]
MAWRLRRGARVRALAGPAPWRAHHRAGSDRSEGMTMRILQVLLSPRIGGAESAAAALAREWERSGASCETVYLDDDQPRGAWRRISELRRTLRRISPDVVVSHSALPNIYARLASSSQSVYCVLHSATRDFDDRKIRLAERLLTRRTAAVIAVSEEQRREYLSHFPNQRVELIPNGIPDEFRPGAQYHPGAPVITVGRVARQKDPDLWAEAAAAVLADRPTVRFEWYGPTMLELEWEDLVARHSAPDGSVVFRGPTDHVATVLRSGSIFFHPSRREAHSVAILEAAASGLPVVCSDSVAETLPDWLPRTTFRGGQASDAARALKETFDDLPLKAAEAALHAANVRDQYGIERTAAAYLEVISR